MANPLITNFDLSKLFIWNNRFKTGTYTNGTGSTVTLAKGTLMGRIWSTGKLTPCVSTATNGSQFPIGVLQNEYVVLNAASATVSICFSGDIAREGVTLGGSDTFTTIIAAVDSASPVNTVNISTIEDYLNGRGIILPATSEHTYQDNQ